MSNVNVKAEQAIETKANATLIYQQIPKAIAEIGAIGKNKRNTQQGFQYRGIDDVYNAVSPVLAKCGLFLTSEVLDQQREERETKNGGRIVYTILTMRFTIWATDGSSVTTVTVGEGMDSGDKGSNKAMSIAYKYALFQLLCIPTEAVDPDSEVHPDVLPRGKTAGQAQVTRQSTVPPQAPVAQAKVQETPEQAAEKAAFVKDNVARINSLLNDPDGFTKFRTALIARGEMSKKPSSAMTKDELTAMFQQIEREARRLGMIKGEGDAA